MRSICRWSLFRGICGTLLLGLFLAGPVFETGCGPSGSETGKPRKKKPPKPKSTADEDYAAVMGDAPPPGPKKDPREEERRVREEWEARQRAEREQTAAEAEATRQAAEEARRRREEEEAARVRAEEERRRREEEEARRRELEEKYLASELEALNELEPKIERMAAEFAFDKAVEALKSFQEGLKTEGVKERTWELLEHQMAMKTAFQKMVSRLQPGVEVKLGPKLTFTVEKVDETSVSGKVGRASLTRKWTEFDKGVLLALFEWEDMEADDHFGTGLLAYAFGRIEEAEKRLLIAAKMDASRAGSIAMIVAARRGAAAGTVLLPYKGMWVSEEEKKYIDEGKELYQGKWLSNEEIMRAKGFVLHEGRWLTQEEYEDATKEARKLRELQKKLAPKGLIDKPGADSEQLEWGEARKYKSPWGNYMVEANLSEDAIKDIAYIMEVLQWNFRKIFRIRKNLPKYFIKIAKNKAEYDGCLGGGGLGKCGGGEISTFYQPPNTTMVLMHEGTHQIINKFAPCCPVWWHEAMATYFECSKFVVNPETKSVDLKTGCVNRWRLGPIQMEIKNGTCKSLRDHIKGNIGGLQMYHQGWALSYYLINAKGGRYAARYFYFIEKHAGKGGTGRKKGQPEDKMVMRFMQTLGIFDLDEFEKEWKEYILALKLEEADDFNSGHR